MQHSTTLYAERIRDHVNPDGTVDMIGVDADRLREMRATHPDHYQKWFGGDLVNLTGTDREAVRDALIAIAERPDMTIVETGDQINWLLWDAPWWGDSDLVVVEPELPDAIAG